MTTVGQAVQLGHDRLQGPDRAATGMDGARAKPGRQGKTRRAVEGVEREILMLVIVAVKATQDLLAMRWIIGRIQVDDDERWCLPTCADKQFRQVSIEDFQALAEGSIDFAEDVTVLDGQFGLATCEGLLEACHGGATGEWPVRVGGNVGKGLEKGIVTEALGIVTIGVVSQDLIDLLGQQGLAGVDDELLRSRIGQTVCQLGEDAEFLIQRANGE